MSKYLLACSCGSNLVVDVRQAGEQLQCPCGAQLAVPPLRKLRHLPLAETPAEVGQAAWSSRQATVSLLLIGALAAGSLGAWAWWKSPVLEKPDFRAELERFKRDLPGLTPIQGWAAWRRQYHWLGEVGFSDFRDPRAGQIRRQQQRYRLIYGTAFSTAAVFLVVALVAGGTLRRAVGRSGR